MIKKSDTPIGGSAKIIAVTSGKGGVGKTSLTVNIAASFIKKREKGIDYRCRFRTFKC